MHCTKNKEILNGKLHFLCSDGKNTFHPFLQWRQVWFPLLYNCLILLHMGTWIYYSLFLLCSISVPTLICSVPVRFILCYEQNFDGSVQSSSLNQQFKKRDETTQNKRNQYYKNIIIQVLNTKIKKN